MRNLASLAAVAVVCAMAGDATGSAARAQGVSEEDLARRTIERRAVEAAIWGMPLVSFDAMRQAFFRDAHAGYGDILYFSKPADWKFQIATPNASSLYVYLNFNLKDGPVALDVPAAVGAGLFGSLNDAWQTPLMDVGPEGGDKGKGGKYLLLPPGYKGAPPRGYIPVQSSTYNGYALFRAIPATSSGADLAKALDLVKQMRVYPLARAANPLPSRYIDITGRPFDGIARFDDTFYDSLARMVNEEPMQSRDLVAIAQLRSLGIEKGKEFTSDQATRDILKQAIAEAHAWFMQKIATGQAYWPNKNWIISAIAGPKTGFTYMTADYFDVDERGATFFLACAPPKKLGAASLYVGSFRDAKGQPLQGDKTYRLRVPSKVPAKQFWAVTVYDLATAGFIREAPRLAIDSYQDVQKNADGSVDVYFGPVAPAGHGSNWIYTAPGEPWFAFFRFYGPEKPVVDKTWVLGNIEQVP